MVVTKIEAGKYSIVTSGGMKFEAVKQCSHCWAVINDFFVPIHLSTLKECKEWAEKQTEKPAEPVKTETVAETDEPAETVKDDEPKSRVEKLMPEFVSAKVIFHTPTQEVYDLLMKEFEKHGFRWRWDATHTGNAINANSSNRWELNKIDSCLAYRGRPIDGRVGYSSKDYYMSIFPSTSIVTLTTADFDKPKKEFTKADLKTGMVVECRDGERFMVIEGEYECACGCTTNPMLIGEDDNWLDGMNTNSNLTNKTDPNYNIDKVYAPKMQGIGRMFDTVSDRDLIWQRKPEYDWSKAEADMPILVKAKADRFWHKRYFAKYEDGIVFAWTNGRTSWITNEISGWGCAVPYKGNEHLVEGEDK